MRGAGWGRKHSVVDYVFTHDPAYLVAYHGLIMAEMEKRGYHPDEIWYTWDYRGKNLGIQEGWVNKDIKTIVSNKICLDKIIYPEHNDAYLQECLDNLKNKGINIEL